MVNTEAYACITCKHLTLKQALLILDYWSTHVWNSVFTTCDVLLCVCFLVRFH